MDYAILPATLDQLIDPMGSWLDPRQRDLWPDLFTGTLLANGSRTATDWFRAADIPEQFRRAYTLIASAGRHAGGLAWDLFRWLRRHIDPGPRWLFGLDDTPTKRYGPHVEGAGIHHNPTPGPAHQRFLYGHVFVTLAWLAHHPHWHTRALPLLADLYIRQADLAKLDPDRRPDFKTKLQLAADQVLWLARGLSATDRPVWVVVDGFYAKRPFLSPARKAGVVVVGRLRRDAALFDVPQPLPPGRRPQGRPRTYGTRRYDLGKRAAHPAGWQEVTVTQYGRLQVKTVKTFLATWRPAGGLIRVVIVRERDGWRAYFCTDAEASVESILEAAADRTAIEQTFCDVKEEEGAGRQQLRNREANVGAFCLNLWAFSAVEGWAWGKADGEVCDRTASAWDREERRPSHADKRKAFRRGCLRRGFSALSGGEGWGPEMARWWEWFWAQAA